MKNFTQSPELRIILPEKSWVIFLNGNCSQICFPKYTLKERLKIKISYSYMKLQNRVTKFKLQNQVAKFSYAKWRDTSCYWHENFYINSSFDLLSRLCKTIYFFGHPVNETILIL